MRRGCILAEDTPETLMSRYGLPTLEATFLAVCRAQGVPVTVRDDEQPVLADEKSRLAAAEAAGVAASAGSVQVSEDTPLITAAPSPPGKRVSMEVVPRRRPASCFAGCRRIAPRPRKTFAVTLLGFTRLRHMWGLLVFDLLIPTIQVLVL